ncbi:MAG: hypothetical protein L0099_04815 [Acidobacteria bacterium]|nr:hypothetical protein [Acidobacteriota bacterium]
MRFGRFLPRKRPGSRQAGYALLVILLALAFLLIAMTRSAPDVVHQIKREREEELIQRGTQYARAIGRYFRKFGRYPSRIEELENTNNIRFLRRRYKDPMTPDGEWRLVRFGDTRLGSRGGTPAPGAPAGTPAGGLQATPGGVSRTGGSTPGRSGDSLSGRTFGGGPIVGVASKSTASSIRERDGKTHYNEWEFIYDVTLDPAARQGQPGAPGPPGRPGAPVQPGTPAEQPQPQQPLRDR